MFQIFFVTEIYLLLASAIILSDRFGSSVLILFNLKSFYESKRVFKIIGIAGGLLLVILMAFFPVEPGPAFLGDFLPESAILFVILNTVSGKRSVVSGYICLTVAVFHFLFPSFVIL